jgi:hypothetical protein
MEERWQEAIRRMVVLAAIVRDLDEAKAQAAEAETSRLIANALRAKIDSLPPVEAEHENTADLHTAPHPSGHVAPPVDDEGSLTPGSPSTSGQYPTSKPALSRAPAQPQFRTPAGVSLGTADDDFD